MAATTVALLIEAQQALRVSYRGLAAHAGSSQRTVQRWMTGQSAPVSLHLQRLAAATRALDPDLAERLAAAGGTTLEELDRLVGQGCGRTSRSESTLVG
jgi:transcriptional regulator with XRE-family HTH domain